MKKNYGKQVPLMFGLLMTVSGAHALSLPLDPGSLTWSCAPGYMPARGSSAWDMRCIPNPPLTPIIPPPIRRGGKGKEDRQGQPQFSQSFSDAQEKTAGLLEAVSVGDLAAGQAALSSLFEGFGGKTKQTAPRRGFIRVAADSCFDGSRGNGCEKITIRPTRPDPPKKEPPQKAPPPDIPKLPKTVIPTN